MTYTPSKDFNGDDELTFAVKEEGSSLPSAMAKVSIAVANDDNDPPLAEDVLLTVKEDSLDNAIQLKAVDPDSTPSTTKSLDMQTQEKSSFLRHFDRDSERNGLRYGYIIPEKTKLE